MNSLSLVREFSDELQTKGQLFVMDQNGQVLFQCFTLELPWRNNERSISSIPEGRYPLIPRFSDRFKNHLHILNVPGRDLILIHEANFVNQLRGCIAVGDSRLDLNGDGLKDLTNSVRTKNKLLEFITGPSEIVIGS
jgi:hypothetical protein